MTNEGGGIYSPSHWTNCPCGCDADENQKVGADETAKEGEVIVANKKPNGGGWHWPTYWQAKADEAKDVTPNANVTGLAPAQEETK